ncbi:MAG: hypothetical protein R3B13_03605 [Polyangiaceae bacterium]
MSFMRSSLLATMVLGGSFIAGCCGGPSGGESCTACVEQSAETGTSNRDQASDAGSDASDAGSTD